MRAGQLRDTITVQRLTTGQDDFGGIVEAWADLYTCRAAVRTLTGREFFSEALTLSEVTHRILIRKHDITVTDRILFEDRIFNINAVLDKDQKGVSLEIMAKELN